MQTAEPSECYFKDDTIRLARLTGYHATHPDKHSVVRKACHRGASSKAFAKPAIPRVIFPNVDEIRRSLDGYASGGSIHTKIQSKVQQKQVDYLRPRFCYWAGDHDGARPSDEATREAGRRRAAPHIKTYVRFTNSDMKQIDWAMVTSANLSCQAWGTLPNKDGEIRISSYELGVVVWPALFDDEKAGPGSRATEMKGKVVTTSKTIMVPAFKSDIPEMPADNGDATQVLGFRMPYDLPLVRYTKDDLPWCATSQYDEPDWRGQTWQGFER
jgi:tyrosyl-DNA phosphodiesterase-1